MRELRVELFHRGNPLESIKELLKIISLELPSIPESFEQLYEAVQMTAKEDSEANPDSYDWHVTRRSSWELLVATPSNILILINLVSVEFRYSVNPYTVEMTQQLISCARENGCPTWADGVSV